MEKKTDLSEEFGHSSNFASREFGANFARLDPKTNLSPELNRSPNSNALELSGAYTNKEFSIDSNDFASTDRVPPPKPSRQEQHRHSLLLQMASVGLSAVVVTNALGMDILGDDLLFSHPGREYIAVEEVIEESRHDEDSTLETIYYVIHSSDRESENPGPYADTVRYDDASNTLYLDGCRLDQLCIGYMEKDVTIFVESTSYIGLLSSSCTNITISGNQDASLIINLHTDENWWYGIVMYGEGGDVALTISPEVIVNVRGAEGAIAVDNTKANPGIRYDSSRTFVTSALHSGDFPFSSGAFVEGGSDDWTFFDDYGDVARQVIFAPVGYDVSSIYDPEYDLQYDSSYGWDGTGEDHIFLPDTDNSRTSENGIQQNESGEFNAAMLVGDWTVIAASTYKDGVITEDEDPSGSLRFTEDERFTGTLDREESGIWAFFDHELWADGAITMEYLLICEDDDSSSYKGIIDNGTLHIYIYGNDGGVRSFMLAPVN